MRWPYAGAPESATIGRDNEQDGPTPDGPSDAPATTALEEPPVVGIGFSAGGLQALTDMLEALSDPGEATFIVLQHTRPDDESRLPEVLARHTALPVEVARDGTTILPRHIYVAPPSSLIRFDGDRVRLAPRPPGMSHVEIDTCLSSLAENFGPRAVGIILSGTMSDGVAGMQAIKAIGGTTMVQSLDTAAYRQLPGEVIEAGAMDVVLPPADLATQLMRLTRKLRPGEESVQPAPTDHLGRILKMLLHHTGVDFAQYKGTTVMRRLARRMTATQCPDMATYAAYLASEEAEVQALYRDLLIHVTSFFRDPEFYDALEAKVVRPLVEAHEGHTPIRIWIPGCATGEEAYSIGMLFLEAVEDAGKQMHVQVFGTDLSDAAIRHARRAIYPPDALEAVTEGRRARFFESADEGMRITGRLRDMCLFAVHDLTRDPPFSGLDLLSCRNVLIYMDRRLQRRLFSTFHYAVRDGGFLALGPSEARVEAQELFALADENGIYSRRSVPTQTFAPVRTSSWPHPVSAGQPAPTGLQEVARQAQDLVSDRYGVAALAVTKEGRIAWSQGEVGALFVAHRPLGKGPVDDELVPEVQKALDGLKQTGRAQHARLETPRGPIGVEVAPIGPPGGQSGAVIVVDAPAPGGHARRRRPPGLRRWLRNLLPGKASRDAEVMALRNYMQHVVEDYEATTEELRSAHEEAMSSNEELLSTNEELETAREELQSANEELATVNEELVNRTDAAVHVRDELANLVRSLGIPILAVGRDLTIRRFTPKARDAFNLIDTDVGRPLTQINTGLDADWLSQSIRQVADTMELQRKDVEAFDGNAYELTILPLRTEGDRVEGAVLILLPR